VFALALFLAAGCSGPQATIQPELATQLASRPSSIDLASLHGGNWDRLVIVGPYTTPEELDSVLGFHFGDRTLADSIARSDGINVIILVSAQTVVAAETVTRSVVDFGDPLPLALAPNGARFSVTWVSNGPILHLTEG